MNFERPSTVSVIDPINPAIDRVRLMLFSPFDLGRWFVIGFCAFLANLGSGGNGGGNGGGGGNSGGGSPADFREAINYAKDYLLENLYWIGPLVLVVFILVLIIGLILAWLSSRGRFMFLHCVAGNKAEVKIPWAKFREHANSLFLFRIVLALIGIPIILISVILIIVLVGSMISAGAPAIGAIFGVVLLVIGLIIFSICIGLTGKFTTDFVVPIMFLRTVSIRAAWKEFLIVLSNNKARFFLYLLFQIVIGIAITIITIALFCVTCCVACCLAIIPYIGTVLLLPLFVFRRAYSLYYLKQYGPQFDVFSIEAENLPPEIPENTIENPPIT